MNTFQEPLNSFQWQTQEDADNYKVTLGEKIALVFGNEVGGVNEEVMQMADECIEIPQWGSKHSLNISVSMGVVLWEMVRGRQL